MSAALLWLIGGLLGGAGVLCAAAVGRAYARGNCVHIGQTLGYLFARYMFHACHAMNDRKSARDWATRAEHFKPGCIVEGQAVAARAWTPPDRSPEGIFAEYAEALKARFLEFPWSARFLDAEIERHWRLAYDPPVKEWEKDCLGRWVSRCPACGGSTIVFSYLKPGGGPYGPWPGRTLCAGCAVPWIESITPDWQRKLYSCCESGTRRCMNGCTQSHSLREASRKWTVTQQRAKERRKAVEGALHVHG